MGNRDTLQKILIGLLLTACIFLGIQVVDTNNNTFNFESDMNSPRTQITAASSTSRMTYGRFLEYL